MKRHLAIAAAASCLAVALPAAAQTVRGTLSAGVDLGLNDHPADGGLKGGLDLDAQLRVWHIVAGAAAGYDVYGSAEGPPISATTLAARLGAVAPIAAWTRAEEAIELSGLFAAELGVHRYSPDGEDRSLLGSSVTFRGPSRGVRFLGLRAGAVLESPALAGDFGLTFRFELIGRRDRGTTELAYTRVSCGGLFDSGCSDPDPGAVQVGGTELAAALSMGLLIGR